ncbi:MAG: carbon-nitrogen hydrolase family protein [Thermoguttaceae bacterium]
MCQMLVQYSQLHENLQQAEKMLELAKRQGAEIALLPECLDIGWANPDAIKLAQPMEGEPVSRLKQAAIAHKIYVVGGVTERVGDKLYNTAVLLSPEGELLAKHRKINLLVNVEYMYEVGRSLCVCETALGRIGIDICADNWNDSIVLGHSLGRMGAQVLLSPCAWAVPRGFDQKKTPYGQDWVRPFCELARLYNMPIVAVSNVGKVTGGRWRGWDCIGNSIALWNERNEPLMLPFGVDAECVQTIEFELQEHPKKGTDLSGYVREQARLKI